MYLTNDTEKVSKIMGFYTSVKLNYYAICTELTDSFSLFLIIQFLLFHKKFRKLNSTLIMY